MIIPVRCFTCCKVIGNLWEKYQTLCQTMEKGKALDELGLERFCCRRMLLTHVEIIDTVILYSNNSDDKKTENTNGKDEVAMDVQDSSSSSSSSSSVISTLSTTNRIVYKKPEKEPRIYLCR